MPNYRITYASNAMAVKADGETVWTPIHGLQTATLNTNFTQEQVYEMGQLEPYENLETLPNIEVQVERVLDGEALLYHIATQNATSNTLISKTKEKCNIAFSIYNDDVEQSAGTPISTVTCSGMYVNSLTYNLPVNANFTEQISFVGNDKLWSYGGGGLVSIPSGVFGSDSPVDTVKRRQHVLMGASASGSIWPTDIPGISVSGYNEYTGSDLNAHIQDVNISINLGREDLFELGRRKPYYRYATTPIQVQTTISVTPGGTTGSDGVNADSERDNLTNQVIKIFLSDGTIFDLGTKNKLSTVNRTFAAAGQSTPAADQYTYTNFNIFTVTSPAL